MEKQNFVVNILKVESSEKEIRDHPCSTECGDSGCRCTIKQNRYKSMDEIDHLLLVSDTGHVVHCLCGDYQVSASRKKDY